MFKLVTGIFQLLTCIFSLLTGIFKLANWYIQVNKTKKAWQSSIFPNCLIISVQFSFFSTCVKVIVFSRYMFFDGEYLRGV